MRSFQKTLAAVAASAALVAAYAQSTTPDNGSGVPSADVQSPVGAPTSSHATNPEKDRLSTTGVLRDRQAPQQSTAAAPMSTDSSSTAASTTTTDNSANASSGTTDNSAAAGTSDNSTAVATAPRADRN